MHTESEYLPDSPEENPEFLLPSPGILFKEARREKGLALEQIARSTRISLSNLIALEEDRYQDLPADAFVRGYLKMIAKEVDEDEELWLAAYNDILNTGPPTVGRKEKARPRVSRSFSLDTMGFPLRVGHVLAVILAIMGFFLFYFALEGGSATEDATVAQPEGALIEMLDTRPLQRP